MASKSQKYRLGLFIIISSFSLLLLLFIIGSKRFLQEKETYYISYRNISVSGLEVGSPVKYLGISIGSITKIDFDPEDIYNVVVTIGVAPGTPIKEDARANIEAIGITGLKMIELRGGSNKAKLLEPEGYINPGSSITEAITGKAEIIAAKVEHLVNNVVEFTREENLEKVLTFIENSNNTINNINTMVLENRKNLNEGIASGRSVLAKLDTISSSIQHTTLALKEIVETDTVKQIVANVHALSENLKAAKLAALVDRLSEAVESTNRVLIALDRDMEHGSKDFFISVKKLKSTINYLNETTRMLNEDPSILIHGVEVEDIPDDNLD